MEKDIWEKDVCEDVYGEDNCGEDICKRDICERDDCKKEVYRREVCEKDGGIKRQLFRRRDSQLFLRGIKAILEKKRSRQYRVRKKDKIDAGAK